VHSTLDRPLSAVQHTESVHSTLDRPLSAVQHTESVHSTLDRPLSSAERTEFAHPRLDKRVPARNTDQDFTFGGEHLVHLHAIAAGR
jgi:hypothetical protein